MDVMMSQKEASMVESISGNSSHSLISGKHYYCKIAFCPASMKPCLDIRKHVLENHPDTLEEGYIFEIDLKLNLGKRAEMVRRLVVAHEKIFWVSLNYNGQKLICGSIMLDKDDQYYPTHSVSIILSGFGHEILLSQNFESKNKSGNRPLNDPVTNEELSKIVDANNRISAIVHVMRRPARKIRVPKNPRSTTQLGREKKVAHQTASHALLPPASKISTPFHCVVSTCGRNLDRADFMRHVEEIHPDLFIRNRVGYFTLTLDHQKKDQLLFNLMEAYGEKFVVMVAFWQDDGQLQLGSLMEYISPDVSYKTIFKMSRCKVIVEQTQLKRVMNNHYTKRLKEKTFAMLPGCKVQEMTDSEGKLKITVKIVITSYQDSL